MKHFIAISLLSLAACAHAGPETTASLSALSFQADSALPHVAEAAIQTAQAEIDAAGEARFRFDFVLERTLDANKLVYEARVVVIDIETQKLRHFVRSVASADIRRRGGSNRLERKVAQAATHRATRDALSLVATPPRS